MSRDISEVAVAVRNRAHIPGSDWAVWFWPVFLAVLVLDQVTKTWLFAQPIHAPFSAHFPGAIEQMPAWIERSYNRGVAWGVFGSWPVLVVCLTAVMVPVITFVWWKHFRLAGRAENLAFAAILAGAIGNGIDRFCFQFGSLQGVRDFIRVDLHAVGIPYTWPTFNIADSGITVGFVLLAILSFARSPSRTSDPGARLVV